MWFLISIELCIYWYVICLYSGNLILKWIFLCSRSTKQIERVFCNNRTWCINLEGLVCFNPNSYKGVLSFKQKYNLDYNHIGCLENQYYPIGLSRWVSFFHFSIIVMGNIGHHLIKMTILENLLKGIHQGIKYKLAIFGYFHKKNLPLCIVNCIKQ